MLIANHILSFYLYFCTQEERNQQCSDKTRIQFSKEVCLFKPKIHTKFIILLKKTIIFIHRQLSYSTTNPKNTVKLKANVGLIE